MRPPQFVMIALCGMAAAGLGGFVAVVLVALIEAGVEGLLGGLFFGLFGAVYAVPVAALPAMALGGLLWGLRVQHGGIWAGIGAAAGVGCLGLGQFFPGGIGETVALMSAPNPAAFAAPFAMAGALAALFFRNLMRAFSDYEAAPSD